MRVKEKMCNLLTGFYSSTFSIFFDSPARIVAANTHRTLVLSRNLSVNYQKIYLCSSVLCC